MMYLKVRADVQVVLAMEPRVLQFGTIRKGQPAAEKRALLTGFDKGTVKIERVTCQNKYIQAELETRTDGDTVTGQQIKVRLLQGLDIGRHNEKVVVYTDHERLKQLSFYVFVRVVGDINVYPSSVSFGIFRKGGKYDKHVIMTAAPGVRFKILEVKSPYPDMVTRVETVREGKEYVAHISLLESFDQDFLEGNLTIITDNKDNEKIEVKVFGKGIGQRMIQ